MSGKKFVAAGLQTRPFAAPHKNEDRPHLQVNNTTKTLSDGPAGGAYPHFCEGLQTAWFAARLQQIFFPMSSKPRRGAAALPAVLRYWPPHAAALALVQRGPLPSPSPLTTHQPPSWLRRCCRHGTMSTPSPVCRCLEWRYSSTVSSTSIHDDSSLSLSHNKLGRQREALLLHIVHSLDMGQASKQASKQERKKRRKTAIS
jgi:hypothetical protein